MAEEAEVSVSGTGPRDPAFPYEWLWVRQYISMPCFMTVNLPVVPSSAKASDKALHCSRVSPSHCPSSVTLWTYDEVT